MQFQYQSACLRTIIDYSHESIKIRILSSLESMFFRSSLQKIVLIIVLFSTTMCWFPKIVWTFWEEPFKDIPQHHLLQTFLKNFQYKLSGWQRRHLNKQTMWMWLNQIQGFKQFYQSQAIQNELPAKRSDYVRLIVLKHYGGVYIDVTTILTRDLDWLLQLKSIKQVSNKYGNEPDLFLIHSSDHGSKQRFYDKETKKHFLIFPTYQDFFIAAKPNAPFISDWIQFLFGNKLKSWDIYRNHSKSLIVDIADEEKIFKGGFDANDEGYYDTMIAAQIVLNRKQKQLDEGWIDKKKPRPLAVKYYKTWVMGSIVSAYKADSYQNPIKLLSQKSISQLQYENWAIPYFSKLYRYYYYLFQTSFLVTPIFGGCTDDNYILDSSIVYTHLLRRYPIVFYKNCIFDDKFQISSQHKQKVEREQNLNKIIQQFWNNMTQLKDRISTDFETAAPSLSMNQKQKMRIQYESNLKQKDSNYVNSLNRIKFQHLDQLQKLKSLQQKNYSAKQQGFSSINLYLFGVIIFLLALYFLLYCSNRKRYQILSSSQGSRDFESIQMNQKTKKSDFEY